MAALPNTGALCSTPQSLADAHYRVPCSNAAKTRNPLKLAGVPQTRQQISAISMGRSSPYCAVMWRRYCCLTSFFPTVSTCLSCKDMARQTCAMVRRWRIFCGPVFSASRVQHISDVHSKFALRPHHGGSMVDIQSATAEIR